MNIITYKLEERAPDGKLIGIETGYTRTNGLTRFDQKLRENAEHYPHKRRLVLVQDGDR